MGRQARWKIANAFRALKGADVVFITAGMGGGTGTGAAPVVAQLARRWASSPWPWSPKQISRSRPSSHAGGTQGHRGLSHHCDSLITIPNEKLLAVLGRKATVVQARAANDVLQGAVQGIADLIVRRPHQHRLCRRAYSDERNGHGDDGFRPRYSGDRATAAEMAISNPLLEDVNLSGACGI
ncbi:MAG: hypothetical protein H7A20_09720 [Rhodanobacteraceae bacterium]|nr:hypothetical protein [Rhodanobacteraceae bacterium]